jgi:hypothetical protein
VPKLHPLKCLNIFLKSFFKQGEIYVLKCLNILFFLNKGRVQKDPNHLLISMSVGGPLQNRARPPRLEEEIPTNRATSATSPKPPAITVIARWRVEEH